MKTDDKSFTTRTTVRVTATWLRGTLAWRAEEIREGNARPWRRLANDCAGGLWPCEVALLLPSH